MRTNLFYYILCIVTCLFSGCEQSSGLFAPDGIWYGDKDKIWVSNRSNNELWMMDANFKPVCKTELPGAVNDLLFESGRLWVVCDGSSGSLCELNPEDLSLKNSMQLGHTPSALHLNKQSASLWVTLRYLNELWEIDPDQQQIKTKLPVGREPVDLLSFNADSSLLVVNNLPEMAADNYPVCCQLDIIDVLDKKPIRRIQLPNGSTDVKAITADGDKQYAYVVHLLARYQLPTNQVDRGWMSTNALTVIDLSKGEVLNTVLLDTPQKGAANPWDIICSPDQNQLWVVLAGTHELACIDRQRLHQRLDAVLAGEKVTPSTTDWASISNDAGFLYGIREFYPLTGKGPRAVCNTSQGLCVANYYTGDIACLSDVGIHTVYSAKKALADTPKGMGDLCFHDATICFQQWQSCASCHPNEARMDGLNWDLLNDGIGNPKNTKSLLFAHQTPPCMITGIRKNAETAVRSGIKYILFADPNEEHTVAIDHYLKSLKPLSSPYLVDGRLSESAERGKIHFEAHCASCHSGEYYTDQKQYPVDWAESSEFAKKMDVPALNETWRTAPYLYDGRSYTMREMISVHGPKTLLPELDLDDLVNYVLSL